MIVECRRSLAKQIQRADWPKLANLTAMIDSSNGTKAMCNLP